MHTFGIIGAMTCEIDLLKENMEVNDIKEIAGITFYEGTIHNERIILACSGVGKVNASACTQILISEYKVNYIINTGVAGAIAEDLEIGDIVISDNVTHHDLKQWIMKQFFPFKEYFEADKDLINLAVTACEKNEDIKRYQIGRIVSGEVFVDNKELKDQIREEYNPMCVEMEGAAIGHVSNLNGIPFVIIRSISDKANEPATGSFEEFVLEAATKSSHLIISMILDFSQKK